MAELTRDEMRFEASQSAQAYSLILATKLGADEAWRMLLANAVSVAQAEYTTDEIAEMLRQMADGVDAGGLSEPLQ